MHPLQFLLWQLHQPQWDEAKGIEIVNRKLQRSWCNMNFFIVFLVLAKNQNWKKTDKHTYKGHVTLKISWTNLLAYYWSLGQVGNKLVLEINNFTMKSSNFSWIGEQHFQRHELLTSLEIYWSFICKKVEAFWPIFL